MRRTVRAAALSIAALAIGSGPALAGTVGGNGAQESALSPASTGNGGCTQGSGSASEGWAILNKTGAPVAGTSTVQGEVHIVDRALAGQTVMAFVVPSSSNNCMSAVMAAVTVNQVGIGNGHLAGLESTGSYYVAIMKGTTEVLASQAVNLK